MTTPEELTPASAKEREFEENGFTHNFTLTDTAVMDVDGGAMWDPRVVRIVDEHRQEGITDPGDESVVMALETPDGVRGTLVASYGPAADHAEALRLLGTAVDQD